MFRGTFLGPTTPTWSEIATVSRRIRLERRGKPVRLGLFLAHKPIFPLTYMTRDPSTTPQEAVHQPPYTLAYFTQSFRMILARPKEVIPANSSQGYIKTETLWSSAPIRTTKLMKLLLQDLYSTVPRVGGKPEHLFLFASERRNKNIYKLTSTTGGDQPPPNA